MENITKILEVVISNIMTDMFFLFADDEENVEPPLSGSGFELILKDPNRREYRFYFIFSENLALEMTDNFSGVDEHSPRELQIRSTIQEYVNMVVGNILNQVDNAGQLDMGVPRWHDEQPTWTRGLPSIRKSFNNNHMDVWVGEFPS